MNVCRALSYIHAATHAAVHCAPKGGEGGGGRVVQEESNHVGNSRIYTRNENVADLSFEDKRSRINDDTLSNFAGKRIVLRLSYFTIYRCLS